ncbi:MAG: haloacid dehalogenase type II [Pseudomonadota bacterium]
MDRIRVLLFDTFGTLTDWRGSIAREGARLGKAKGLEGIDWDHFARAWRAGYKPGMAPIIEGTRPFTSIDVIHREQLDVILEDFGISAAFNEEERHDFNLAWHRLEAWPDTIPGMIRLKPHYLLSPLSNGSIILLSTLAKRTGLPFDFVFSSDTFRAFKRDPAVYLGAIAMLGLAADEIMMVAAHNDDLEAARSHGMRTAYVNRPYEYGSDQTVDYEADEDWDVITDTIGGLAYALGR